jgi:hypothetical protein
VSNELAHQVSVRRLPDGDYRSAVLSDLKGSLLSVNLLSAAPGPDFCAGDLVEVDCPKTVYLGEVRLQRGGSMTIGIEHALDRETLTLIHQVWLTPANGK